MSGKENGMQNLPVVVQEYISLIIKKMRYRRKVRADVRAELINHFEDELRSIEDQAQKEKKAGELIVEFGDAKLLGVLMRRAKKRCRPLWRTAVVRTFQAIGIMFGLFIVYCVYISLGVPTIRIDYVNRINQMARPVADESLNAAALYDKAMALYIEEPKLEVNHTYDYMYFEHTIDGNETYVMKKDLLDVIRGKRWIDELEERELNALKSWINSNQHCIEFYKQGSLKPYCWWERSIKENESLFHLLLPELSKMKDISRMIECNIRIKAEHGDIDGAFEDIIHIYRAGEHFKGPRTLVEQLVGIAIQSLAVNSAFEIISRKEVSPKQLERFHSNFQKSLDNAIYTVDFQIERFFFMDLIQRCYTDDGRGSGRMSPIGLKRYASDWDVDLLSITEDDWTFGLQYIGMSVISPNREKLSNMVDKYYDSFDEYAKLTPWQGKDADFLMDIDEWSRFKRLRYWPITYFIPAIKRLGMLYHRTKVTADALVTVIALKRFEQANDVYPETLSELVQAGFLKDVPADPFSSGVLAYKKQGDSFVLYSLGENLKDDGGQVYRNEKGKVRLWDGRGGDAVFWPVQE